MTKIIDYCKGCLTARCRYTTYSGYKTETGIVECPCSICLIKMVCKRECDSYIEFIANANNHLIKEAGITISDCIDNAEDYLLKVNENEIL